MCGGSSSSAQTSSAQTTTNSDNRITNGNGLALSSSSNNTITVQNSDAATLQKISGDAKELLDRAGTTSAAMYDHTIDVGAKLMDKVLASMSDMQKSNDKIASQTIAAYTPAISKLTDTAKVIGVIATGIAVVVVMRKK